VGYGELLRVLEEEASREAREVRAAAEKERDRILAEARRVSGEVRMALLARERAAAEARRKAASEGAALEQERAVLAEQRRLLDALRADVAARLPAPAGTEVLATLLAETLPEAWDGPVTIVVDPGEEEACRALLANVRPDVLGRARIETAPAPRGGVAVVCGRRELDDTLPSRLERAWPAIEGELAAILFAEEA
jgi:V/A-type H+-transporting ATPase subunit E